VGHCDEQGKAKRFRRHQGTRPDNAGCGRDETQTVARRHAAVTGCDKVLRMRRRSTARSYRNSSHSGSKGALTPRRETNVQRLQRVIAEMERHLGCSAPPNKEGFQCVLGEIKGDLECCTPTALRHKSIQHAFRELERAVYKIERVLRSYKDASVFTAADFFADIIKTRRANKAELTPLDIELFQQAFREFQDNFPEYLRMVADILEGKSVRGDDSKIKAAYNEAHKRFNPWFFVPIELGLPSSPSEHAAKVRKLLDTGVLPTVSECLAVFRERNPRLYEPRENRSDGIAPSERSFRRSLERLGLVTRPDKRGRPKEKQGPKPTLTR
jgi:hypothetical protein